MPSRWLYQISYFEISVLIVSYVYFIFLFILILTYIIIHFKTILCLLLHEKVQGIFYTLIKLKHYTPLYKYLGLWKCCEPKCAVYVNYEIYFKPNLSIVSTYGYVKNKVNSQQLYETK